MNDGRENDRSATRCLDFEELILERIAFTRLRLSVARDPQEAGTLQNELNNLRTQLAKEQQNGK